MLQFMKYKVIIPLLIIGALAAFFSFKYVNSDVSGDNRKVLVLNTVMATINEAHFAPQQLNDSFSNRVFNNVIESQDYEKKFFTREDMDKLEQYRYKLDDELKSSSLDFYNLFNELLAKRVTQVEGYLTEIMGTPFTFDGNEEIELNGEKISFAANDKELKDRWYLYLKYRTLSKYIDLKKGQEDRKLYRDTAVVNKDTTKFVVKTNAELEKEARDNISSTMQRYFKRLKKINDDDRFAAYVNAYTESEDPHTNYLPPREKKSFDEQMSGTFFGIGAQLKEEDGKIKIVSIVTGSPCWKQGELKAGDEIMKVGQGANTPEDVTGFEINDVVQKIRGDKGTEVRLTVKKIDGSIRVISIIRGEVNNDEIFAKSAIINSPKGPVGYIYLIEFYSNFNSIDGRRCAEDVAQEVAKLKDAGVKGIILDLRYNGGGSLTDVVDMAGLFVNRGPIVQVRSSDAEPYTMANRGSNLLYDGPLAIMVNQGSASASEIMAAAMQDYKRAVIVGSPTFGKGTVQKLIPLDELLDNVVRAKMHANNIPDIGSLKITIQKFYRVNGGSTQLKGVTPDIQLPDLYSYIDVGERKDKAALGWDEIPPSPYAPFANPVNVPVLKALSEKRVGSNPHFEAVKANAERLKKLEENNVVSLNEKKYRMKLDETTALSKKMEELDKKATALDVSNLKTDLERINTDSVLIEKNKNWLKNLKKDIYIAETVNIINDMGDNSSQAVKMKLK